jgi:hypothetical protein
VGVCLLLLGVGGDRLLHKGRSIREGDFWFDGWVFRRMLRPYDGWGIVFVGDSGLMGI